MYLIHVANAFCNVTQSRFELVFSILAKGEYILSCLPLGVKIVVFSILVCDIKYWRLRDKQMTRNVSYDIQYLSASKSGLCQTLYYHMTHCTFSQFVPVP